MKVLAICHAGLSSPIHACQFASVMTGRSRVAFLGRECFTRQHFEQLKGVIDLSQGVALVYEGPESNWLAIRKALLEHVDRNKQTLAEEWAAWRIGAKSG
jgi:hypothetical protein